MNLCVLLASLLNDTQTFVGVIITLIVLCLYENKDNNYLREIVGGMRVDILGELSSELKELNEAIIDALNQSVANVKNEITKVADKFDFWLAVATKEDQQRLSENRKKMDNIKVTVTNAIASLEADYHNRLEAFANQNNDRMMALFILCISMSVMVVDIFGFSKHFSVPFVAILSLLIFGYSLYIWSTFYLGLKEKGTHQDKTPNKWQHTAWVIMDASFFSLWPLAMCFMDVWRSFLVLIAICVLDYWLHFRFCVFSYVLKKNYTNTEVIAHTIHIFGVAVLVATVFFVLNNLDIGSLFGETEKEQYALNLEVLKTYAQWPVKIFVFMVAFDAFFMPILICYLFYKHHSIRVVKKTRKIYAESQKEMKKLKNEYYRIISSIQDKRTERII